MVRKSGDELERVGQLVLLVGRLVVIKAELLEQLQDLQEAGELEGPVGELLASLKPED